MANCLVGAVQSPSSLTQFRVTERRDIRQFARLSEEAVMSGLLLALGVVAGFFAVLPVMVLVLLGGKEL